MSAYLTLYGLRTMGVDAEIIMFPLSKQGQLRGTEVPVHYTSAPCIPRIGYSPTLKRDIRRLGSYDVYHAQGIWQWNTYALVDVARENDRPYVITPRGMLYPQDIAKRSTLFKRLSLWLRLRNDLNRAACVHVTCNEEMEHCRKLGINSPMAVIPNPVELKQHETKEKDGVFRIGYLGRVSRRKNIHGLINAYINIGETARGTELVIIGDGDAEYKKELHNTARFIKYGTVRFLGFLNGEEKERAIDTLSVLVMPSEFENMGNVVLEALVRHIPCIATKGAPWHELETHGCGWWIDYNKEAIAKALLDAMRTPDDELRAMGERGRRLVEANYSMEAVAWKMKALYDWIIGVGKMPDFVYTTSSEMARG